MTEHVDYAISVITLATLLGIGYHNHRKTKTNNGHSIGELSTITKSKIDRLEMEVENLNEQVEALHSRLDHLFTWLLRNR